MQNLLLDAQGNIKISDFGLSALYVGDADAEGNARSELLHTTCGTPNYVAPEVRIHNMCFTFASNTSTAIQLDLLMLRARVC